MNLSNFYIPALMMFFFSRFIYIFSWSLAFVAAIIVCKVGFVLFKALVTSHIRNPGSI